MNFFVFLKRNWFTICIVLTLILAAFLRFYNFENRWGLAYDQARDVLVAKVAVTEHKIPLIGPFTSAGAFVYGPQWYWILMIFVFLYPYSVLAPWIFQGVLYVVVVALAILTARHLFGKGYGIIVGLLVAVSPAQISHSVNLTSPSMVGIFSFISAYFFIKYIKNKKLSDGFMLAFFVATAINIHFQAIGLLLLLIVALFFNKKSIKEVLVLMAGVSIPFIPLLFFDITNNFYESRGMFQYYFYDQYKISYDVLGRRWLTYLFQFWPQALGNIAGGYSIITYIEIATLGLVSLYAILKGTLSKYIFAIMVIVLAMMVMVRYARTPIFDSYLTFMHPFIFLLVGWSLLEIARKSLVIGFLLILLIVGGSLHKNMPNIINSKNNAMFLAENWKKTLMDKYPKEKFSLYDYRYQGTGYSLPLVLLLYQDEKISDKGYKIGFGNPPEEMRIFHPEIKNNVGFILRDLNSSSSAELAKEEWAFVNPGQVYKSTVEWYKDK